MTDNGYEVRKWVPSYMVSDVRSRYLALYSALVYDAMESIGIQGRAMSGGVYPLIHTMKVAGPAFTVHCVTTPSRDERLHDMRLAMLKSMNEGCIQIRDTQGDVSCGQFGEISAVAARAAGCAGAVIDGSTRDSNFLIDMDFPTFCRFRCPVEAFGRFMAVDYQVPIYVKGIDGLLQINPGDFILGDNDGVVVVPEDKTMEVLTIAEQWCKDETKSRKAMADGRDPFEVYAEFGRF